MSDIKLPELLSPAGNFEKLRAALLYGADAVYLAGEMFGMRSAADNFTLEQLEQAIVYCHQRGKKAYITVNTMPRWNEIEPLRQYLNDISAFSELPDGMIVADMGVAAIKNAILPSVPLHVSTQAGIVSHTDAIAWYNLGAKRAVLARELSLDDIANIRARIPQDMELEVFIHGSMCVSFSGRCLLSNHFTGRDANRGMCTQPCRWNYHVYEIEEEKRPDDRLPILETDRGTFIMSSKDMCMIEHIPELVKSGVSSLKIEGRMKSAYYAAVTANAYRMALDAFADGKPYNEDWLRELDSVSHRPYCTGYFFDDPMENAQICDEDGIRTGYIREKSYIATVQSYDKSTGLAKCVQRNKIVKGSNAEVITPGKTGQPFVAERLFNEEMLEIDAAPHPSMVFYIGIPFEAKPGDIIRQ